MARTLEQIQQSILDKKDEIASLNDLEVLTTSETNNLANLTSTSKVAIWRTWVFIYAFIVWFHESLFDVHKQEINELIALNKIHTPAWYRQTALAFQLGFDLGESAVYNNIGVDPALVLTSKIISQASVEEIAGRLKIKVAKSDAQGVLEPLENTEIIAFTEYMQLVKDAGTRLNIISREPDDFKLDIDLYFNPLVFDAQGQRIDGTENEPVQKAIQEFLYNLDFNGELVLTKLTDYLQQVEGVEMPVIKTAWAKYGGFGYNEINETYIADSGYMVLDLANTNFNFIARGV